MLAAAIGLTALPERVSAQDRVVKEIERRVQDKAERKAAAPASAGSAGRAQPRSWQLFHADDYLALPEDARETYVAGLNDAYNWSYSGGFQRMKWIVACVEGRKAPQLTAMFGKWLKEHPERWHEPAAKLFPFAIFELCRKSREPLAGTGGGGQKSNK